MLKQIQLASESFACAETARANASETLVKAFDAVVASTGRVPCSLLDLLQSSASARSQRKSYRLRLRQLEGFEGVVGQR